MPESLFHPIVAHWFRRRFGEPTEPQRRGWPEIVAGRDTLIAAPTGSGKTLAAFLVCLDRLVRQALEGALADEVQVVYVSPLKALSNDIHRNLEVPLEEIRATAAEMGYTLPPLRIHLRTGDTPPSQRQAMLRRPPHLVVTTPESLYLLLTAPKSRELLRSTRTVIVDEIHALARDKRGSHLALSLERLEALADVAPVRIGLSATQRPIDEIARFLVGTRRARSPGEPPCEIVDVGHVRQLDLAVQVPPSELSAVCSQETWAEVYGRLADLIVEHRSTLVFVNTRRMAERVTHQLSERLGEDQVASHHGSLSRRLRLQAEARLKRGELKAIVATASLELGIDIGFIDLVCQLSTPRSIATLLQRIGRSGHSLGVIPKGRLFPLTRDDLIECMALVRAVRHGRLDAIEIPRAPLDILAQQIVAAAASETWDEDALFDLCRGAWPYRDLPRGDFDRLLELLSEGVARGSRRGAYLHRDVINHKVHARRHARIAASTSGGAIPETADYRVVTEGDETFVGTVNEDFAIESLPGDIFLLGNTSWRIRYVRGGEVVVQDAHGQPATVPFWLGEAPGRTVELSGEVSRLREEIAAALEAEAARCGVDFSSASPPHPRPLSREGRGETLGATAGLSSSVCSQTDKPQPADDCLSSPPHPRPLSREGRGETSGATAGLSSSASSCSRFDWLRDECGVDSWAAEQAIGYVRAQRDAIGLVPSRRRIVFERFFDESGGMQLVVHAPLGARINRAWGLALRKRFCRSFNFELQAAADDNAIILSLGPQHSFPIEQLFPMLNTANGEHLLTQALLAAPMFAIRWRWNVTRALAVLRHQAGRKVPPPLQRMRADDLLSAVFPQSTGCLENHSGDLEVPDHLLVRQTVDDCLHEAMDLDRWLALLDEIAAGRVELIARDTREPSPFCYEILNANPYAFLDDAPLEERRARAVATRRTLLAEDLRELGRLDGEAIEQVRREAWFVVRDAEELHDALLVAGMLPEAEVGDWQEWFAELVVQGRATIVDLPDGRRAWVAAERLALVTALFPDARQEPELDLPESLRREVPTAEASVELVRGRMTFLGPVAAAALAADLGLRTAAVEAALEALEGEGCVLRGHFTRPASDNGQPAEREWCDRRLLARIHRLTLSGARRRVEAVTPETFLQFLVEHQHASPATATHGRDAAREVLEQLQGFELPAGAWEQEILPLRVREYDPRQLDDLTLAGRFVWGRLQPPRRSADDGPSMAGITRVMPISLIQRSELAWLLPPDRGTPQEFARSGALAVLDALSAHGALFFDDLLAATSMLPAQVEDALGELAALGLVTADGFGTVRHLAAAERRHTRGMHNRRRGRRPRGKRFEEGGRWSRFPGFVQPPSPEERAERWAMQLLRRYGVVFRDLLARETAAPNWQQLVWVYRRMEMRGQVHGGRFVIGVAGEQYAEAGAVSRLRQVRDAGPSGRWLVISAADPLNLVGIITPGPRVAANHSNRLVLRDGRLLASRVAGTIEFHEEIDPPLQLAIERALRMHGTVRVREPWDAAAPPESAKAVQPQSPDAAYPPADSISASISPNSSSGRPTTLDSLPSTISSQPSRS